MLQPASRTPQPRGGAWSGRDLLVAAATVGAGAALIETALVPALALVGAAALAPRIAPAIAPGITRSITRSIARSIAPLLRRRRDTAPSRAPRRSLGITQAAAKTITYRVIVTVTDFTWNYVVLGEFGAAAGLSTVSFIAGPVFYFVHEAAWNGFGDEVMRRIGVSRAPSPAAARPGAETTFAPKGSFTIDRALAKTVTFRVFATTMEFTTNFVVVRDAGTAAALTAFGFFVGPFIYLGHEKIWEHYGAAGPGGAPVRRLTVSSAA